MQTLIKKNCPAKYNKNTKLNMKSLINKQIKKYYYYQMFKQILIFNKQVTLIQT